MRIAVIVHVYYTAMFPEIESYLRNLEGLDHDIFFTLPKEEASFRKELKSKFPESKISILPNIGLDIYPFLMMLRKINLGKYDLLCKIYTKKNNPPGDVLQGYDISGGYWRDYLLSSFLGNKERIAEVVRMFTEDDGIGMIGSEEMCLRGVDVIDQKGVDKIVEDLGDRRLKVINREFIAGTMFIARTRIFEPLQKMPFHAEQFPPYTSLSDYYTLQYYMERVLGFLVSAQGYRIAGLKTTKLLDNTNRTVIEEAASHFNNNMSINTKARPIDWPGHWASFKRYRFLLANLVKKDITTKYRRSVLGILWSVLSPLLMMLVITAVFERLFRFNIENFALYYLTGTLVFGFVSEATTSSMNSVLGSAQLIKKVYIPKYIFPLGKCIFAFTNALFSLIAVIIMFLISNFTPPWTAILFPIPLLYAFVFALGFGLILATLQVFFRDMGHLYGVWVTAWVYLTPIIYPVEILPEAVMAVVKFNPMYYYVEYFRMVVLYGQVPGIWLNTVCTLFSVAFMIVGTLVFKKYQDRFILHM